MQYIEAPNRYTGNAPSVFLAGGITGAPHWQTKLAALLRPTPWAVVNPRRQDYSDGDPQAAKAQIAWEYEHLCAVSLVAFWFPRETVCPITLFELGAATLQGKPIRVGTHPRYARRFDVETQLRLRRPEVELVDSIGALAQQIIEAYPGATSVSSSTTANTAIRHRGI